jgi:hypothetical protein
MESLQWLWFTSAALLGATAGAAACHWHMNRAIDSLRQRVERAEQARNGAIERSAQAREQIAQLNQAIAAIRRSHSARVTNAAPATAAATAATTAEERRERAEKALADARPDDATPGQAAPTLPIAFPDTEVMADKS